MFIGSLNISLYFYFESSSSRIQHCFRWFELISRLVTYLNTSRALGSGILIFGEAINTFSRLFKMFSQMRNLSCGCEINADVFNNVVTNTQIRISVLKSNYKLKLTSGVLIKRWDWEIVKCNFSCYSPCNSNSPTYLPTVNLNRLSQMPRQAQMINTNNQD